MINVDISNIWGNVSLPDLLALEAEVSRAHMALTPDSGWLELPPKENSDELMLILDAAQRIRQMSDAVVVIGPCPAARAAVDLLQGPHRNIGKSKGDPAIFFAGDSLSPRQMSELTRLLEGKDYCLIALPTPEGAVETGLALRSLRWMLERKYGTLEARSRIFAVTAGPDTPLAQLADVNEWEAFPLSEGVVAPYLALSPAELLPMAAAGLDVRSFVRGAEEAREALNLRSFENPVWLYAAVRCLLNRNGKTTELLAGWEPGMDAFGAWHRQLFAYADSQGLFPTVATYPAAIGALAPMLAGNGSQLLETLIRFSAPAFSSLISPDALDTDNLNYLSGKTLDYVADQSFEALVQSHTDAGVSIVTAECDILCEKTLGEVFRFFQLSCAICSIVQSGDPDPNSYPSTLLQLLGQPNLENV